MEVLSSKSLADVLNRCHQYAKYQAAILFRTDKQKTQFARSMRAALADNEHGIKSVSMAGTVRFANGSVLRPYAADAAKQKPVYVNEIILGEESIHYAHNASEFLRLEIYHCGEETERDEVSLDDFLGSFKVYKA